MKCYYHSDKDAVGICFSCQKGICKDCDIEIGKTIACKNKCEKDTKDLLELRQRSLNAPHKIKRFYSYFSYACILLGIVFLFITIGETNGKLILVDSVFTIFIFTLGIIVLFYSKQY